MAIRGRVQPNLADEQALQSRASSIDSIGRCLPGSIRGTAKAFTGIR
jgi:hypothetical protein